MAFIDSFVAAVPTANRDTYLEHATQMAEFFKSKGALSVTECWGVDVPPGEKTSYQTAVQCQPDETVVTGWVRWPSKAVRDQAMAEMMSGEIDFSNMPFDGSRLIFGGFEVILDM